MTRIKQIAMSLLMIIFTGLFTLTVTYAFIPTFVPQIAGTPAAWAYTTLFLLGAGIFIFVLLLIVSRQWGDD